MKNLTSNPLALSIAITAALVAPIATAAGHHAGISAASFAPFSADAQVLVKTSFAADDTAIETETVANDSVAPTVELSNEEQALADRMALALNGHKVSKHVAAAKPAKKSAASGRSPDAVFVCGQWEELWQGRGSAQTCDWR